MKDKWAKVQTDEAEVFRISALIQYHFKIDIKDVPEAELSKLWAKLVFCLKDKEKQLEM